MDSVTPPVDIIVFNTILICMVLDSVYLPSSVDVNITITTRVNTSVDINTSPKC